MRRRAGRPRRGGAGTWSRALVAAGAIAAAAAGAAGAGATVTPGLAAGGVPLSADVHTVEALLGAPSGELVDPTNPAIIIERWETLCLGARYTRQGSLLALDVWVDLAGNCPAEDPTYGVEAAGGRIIAFGSTRSDVKQAFGYRPDRVLRAGSFTVLVYDPAGVAFYVREGGGRSGLVDAITVFPRGASRRVWAPRAWGGQ
jgi:hypothetical protein